MSKPTEEWKPLIDASSTRHLRISQRRKPTSSACALAWKIVTWWCWRKWWAKTHLIASKKWGTWWSHFCNVSDFETTKKAQFNSWFPARKLEDKVMDSSWVVIRFHKISYFLDMSSPCPSRGSSWIAWMWPGRSPINSCGIRGHIGELDHSKATSTGKDGKGLWLSPNLWIILESSKQAVIACYTML